jgi:hypothetical protein
VQRLEDASRNATLVADGDWRHRFWADTDRRDDEQRIRGGIVHEDRRAPRADRVRHLAKDRPRRFVERDRTAEDLADRIEQIDLLVTLGELARRVLYLHRRLEVLRDDGQHEVEVIARACARRRTRTNGNPGRTRRRHASDDHRADR